MNNRIAGFIALERLEPCAGKLACTVLRGAGNSNVASLLDFAFVGRQKRITLDGDYFYPDLVFYHILLKRYVVIDLKTNKLKHGDLGQLQMYVNYYDRVVKQDNDNPTIGLLLCANKNDSVVEMTLPKDNEQIFARAYQFHLPTIAQLKREITKEYRIAEARLAVNQEV